MERSVYELLIGKSTAEECIAETGIRNFYVIRSNINLVGIEIEIVGHEKREFILQDRLQGIKDKFDFIFIDCPPSLSLITLNALTSSDSVLIPVQCEYYALEGLTLLLNTIKMIKSRLKPSLEIEGYLLTMFDTRLKLSHQVANEMQQYFKDKVFNIKIMRNVKISESPSYGKPVVVYDPFSIGARNYTELANEFLKRNGMEVMQRFDNLLSYEPPKFEPVQQAQEPVQPAQDPQSQSAESNLNSNKA